MKPTFWARPFAHRGLHDVLRPENSLAAIKAAADAGYGVELDVQPSRDGNAMVFHDYTLDRMTNEVGAIHGRDGDDLCQILYRESDERICTLTEVLNVIDNRVPVLVEIKDQSGNYSLGDQSLTAEVARAIRAAEATTCAVMSFNPHVAVTMREIAPDVPRGIVAYDFYHPEERDLSAEERRALADIILFEEAEADFVTYGARCLPTPRTGALRADGVPVFCWTIRSQKQAEAALRHCDQITFEGYSPR